MATPPMPQLKRVSVSDADAAGWTDQYPFSFRFAKWWTQTMPRGKGWVPRKIGGLFCRNMRSFILTQHGARLAVAPQSLDVYTFLLCNGRTWTPHLLETCRKFLADGSTFYDIGSNVGYFSIELSRLFNELRVVAFEPQPDLARILAVSAALNGFKDLSVYDLMLGHEEGAADLYIPSHSIHASLVSREKNAKKLKLHITTLDALVQYRMLPPPDFIKIDVEGAELEVFRGATATIRDHTPFILFEADDNMARFGNSRSDLIRHLSNLAAYEFFFAADGRFYPVVEENRDTTLYSDVLAIPAQKLADCRRKGLV